MLKFLPAGVQRWGGYMGTYGDSVAWRHCDFYNTNKDCIVFMSFMTIRVFYDGGQMLHFQFLEI
jgi:hypothetical protein